jgi:hypothetical protein
MTPMARSDSELIPKSAAARTEPISSLVSAVSRIEGLSWVKKWLPVADNDPVPA